MPSLVGGSLDYEHTGKVPGAGKAIDGAPKQPSDSSEEWPVFDMDEVTAVRETKAKRWRVQISGHFSCTHTDALT